MIDLISKTVMVTEGPHKGFIGKVVQQEKDGRILVESKDNRADRRFSTVKQVVSY